MVIVVGLVMTWRKNTIDPSNPWTGR